MIGRLSIEALALARGGRPLFSGLNLELAAGEAVALTGANGAGKTSLLRAVAGLLRPTAGRVAFQAPDGAQIEPDEARADALHLLGHDDGLKPGRTAGEELTFWTRWLGGDTQGLQTAEQALELTPLLALEVRKLSAGQRRRLALARLIAAPRALWLLDEPLAPLDAERSARFGRLMRDHLDRGGLVLAAVHSPLPVAARSFAVAGG